MKFESLPDDSLFDILYYLPVTDILRLRRVSRRFHCLTCERTVWFNAYRNSTIIRPPGPFPSQSAEHLERELRKSVRLHENWTSPSPQPVSQRTLKLDDEIITRTISLVLGRYLLVLGTQELRCYDLDLGVDEPSQPIGSFVFPVYRHHNPIIQTYLDESELAPLSITCALLFPSPTERQTTIKLLDLRILDGFARFELKREVHVPFRRTPTPGTLTEKFLFINEVGNPKVLHVPTGQLYHLPPVDFEPRSGARTVTALTSTHLFVQSNCQRVLEAFLLPDDVPVSTQSTRQGLVLTRSHIVFHPFCIMDMFFLSSYTTNARSSPIEDRHNRYNISCGKPNDTIFATFLATFMDSRCNTTIGFLDIDMVQEAPSVGEGSMTVSSSARSDKIINGHSFALGTIQRGCVRIVTCNTNYRLEHTAYTVHAGGDRSIVARDLQIMVGVQAWDGLAGRLCTLLSQTYVDIRNYV